MTDSLLLLRLVRNWSALRQFLHRSCEPYSPNNDDGLGYLWCIFYVGGGGSHLSETDSRQGVAKPTQRDYHAYRVDVPGGNF
ncbi:hypothetical protein OAL10_05290 [Gammaproteobacteria bacterium]|nr:hypothetical protein [Gammaproteobacteria bacterium]